MAIKSNELRLNNTILFSPSGKKAVVKDRYVKVINLLKDSCIVEDNNLSLELFYDSAAMQPAPVNEEILYKLGAVKFPSGKMISLCDRLLDHMECRDVWIDCQTSVELKYVHHVQNFIYVTKGIELSLSGSAKV